MRVHIMPYPTHIESLTHRNCWALLFIVSNIIIIIIVLAISGAHHIDEIAYDGKIYR